ncbi:MAG: hypothetical protein V1723_01820 [Candidatus Uhrbacteria bacterium]
MASLALAIGLIMVVVNLFVQTLGDCRAATSTSKIAALLLAVACLLAVAEERTVNRMQQGRFQAMHDAATAQEVRAIRAAARHRAASHDPQQ